jgi:hypothetical protein
MKRLLYILLLIFLADSAFAGDLTYVAVNETGGSSNGSIDLNVSGGVGPFTYSWSGPGGFAATTEDISGLAAGNYTVTVTDKYCGTATVAVVVGADLSSGIKENEITAVSIYPNPAKEQITITTGTLLENASVRIMNITGKVVTGENSINGNSLLMNVSGLSPGIYFIELKNKNSFSRQKFIKE